MTIDKVPWHRALRSLLLHVSENKLMFSLNSNFDFIYKSLANSINIPLKFFQGNEQYE